MAVTKRTRRPIAALYHRVSTTDQDPKAPLKELERAAEFDGYDVGEMVPFTETGSGATKDRPVLNELMKWVRMRSVRVVYVWKLDRFGRSALDLLTLLQELQRRRTRFVSVSQHIDIDDGQADPAGKMMLLMLAGVAEFERELIRERTRMGLQRARERGVVLGRPRIKLPPAAQIRAARANKVPWRVIADMHGCSVWACKQALDRAAEKGGGDPSPKLALISGGAADRKR